MIATISPARSNLEERLSTLDYAMSAKSIRNKPEINQRMTRNSLLKEYITEIKRLKADVFAAREKNGNLFSEQTWVQIDTERELRETEIDEAKEQVQIIENQMRVAIASLEMMLNDTYDTFNTGYASCSKGLRKTCQQTHEELNHAS
ncbi:hypothetical protein F5877DRAFT_65344 [Lentinula edodes]|nr:hypothetical protein F5877DRAFT_65344 [Lentinula edodes]